MLNLFCNTIEIVSIGTGVTTASDTITFHTNVSAMHCHIIEVKISILYKDPLSILHKLALFSENIILTNDLNTIFDPLE